MNTETVFITGGYVVKIAFYLNLISAWTGYQVHALIPDLREEGQVFLPVNLTINKYMTFGLCTTF